ncbi:MAG TPA: hypothetical protein VHT27_12795 [Solirubrobacteraceae bacterium]|jgi:hypothetical protein|nr:hypothetical protein [Solirubrobacteraceae bacterium]
MNSVQERQREPHGDPEAPITGPSSELGASEGASDAGRAHGSDREGNTEPTGTDSRLTVLLDSTQQTARAMLDAEDALRVLREHFEQTEDHETQADIAASALDLVDRQLELTRERRHKLDGIEGRLWSRRNRLERLLISARGTAWWRAHHREF